MKESEAAEVSAKLGVLFLRQRIASVDQDGQAERFERAEILLPRRIVKLEPEWSGAVVAQIQHFRLCLLPGEICRPQKKK